MNENKDQDYIIEQLSTDRLSDLSILFTTVYGHKPAGRYFNNKFDTAYTGVSNMGYIAYSKDAVPIAFYGVVPCFLKNGDTRILAAQSVDTMTHPDYRYKGMFIELSQLCFQLCRANNVLLLFGFPNQNSHHGALKLGWQLGSQLDFFTIPVKCMPLERISTKSGFTKWLYKAYSNNILKRYQTKEIGLPNHLLLEGFMGIERNEQYLKYKMYNATQVIEIGRAKIWMKIKNGLVIGDISLGGSEWCEVLPVLKTICLRLGIKTISYHCSKGTHMHQLFSTMYTTMPSFPALFQNFGIDVPIDNIKFTFSDIDIF